MWMQLMSLKSCGVFMKEETQAPLLQHDSRTGTDLEFADTRRKMHFIGQHINAIYTLMSPRLVDRDGAKP